jgi:L-gulonolactone oxidase
VRLVDGHGELHRIDGPDLDAARVGLGALGILTDVELAIGPERTLAAGEELRPLVELLDEGFPDLHDWTELEVFPDGHALARWADPVEIEPVGERGVAGRAVAVGSAAAVGSVHVLGRVVPRLAPALRRSASRWSGSTVGPAHRVLVAERPVRAEVSEWALPREALGRALRELVAATTARDLVPRMPVLVRVGASETGWLHPAFGRSTAWIAVRVRRGSDRPLFGLVASVLGDVGGRPHWATRHDWTARTSTRHTPARRTSAASATAWTRTAASPTRTWTPSSAPDPPRESAPSLARVGTFAVVSSHSTPRSCPHSPTAVHRSPDSAPRGVPGGERCGHANSHPGATRRLSACRCHQVVRSS